MKTQQRKREVMMKGLLSLAVVVALAGGASAAIVAQHDGPTDFNGTSDYVTLNDVTIGDEGTVEVEFNADTLPPIWYTPAYLWSCCTSDKENYRVFIGKVSASDPTMTIKVFLWSPADGGDYAVHEEIPFDDTVDWHSLQVTWKDGEETLVVLDDVEVRRVTNTRALPDFSSTRHRLGASPSNARFYDGLMRNVKVYDTYASGPGPDPIPGDANRDRVVNDEDASILAAHWQQAGNWSDGDFNNDGYVNDQDASILAAHWLESQEGTAPVPEPGSVILLIGAALSLLVWRLRCR